MDEHVERLDFLGWIDRSNFSWWDLNSQKHPVELISPEDLYERLKAVGNSALMTQGALDKMLSSGKKPLPFNVLSKRKICIYPFETTPVTVLDVILTGIEVPLVITARPCTIKQMHQHGFFKPKVPTSQSGLENTLGKALKKTGAWSSLNLSLSFLPHVLGYFMDQAGDKILYYPVDSAPFMEDGISPLEIALMQKGFEFVLPANGHYVFSNIAPVKIRSFQALKELIIPTLDRSHAIVATKNARSDKKRKPRLKQLALDGWKHVLYDEVNTAASPVVAYYPTRLEPELRQATPIAISNRNPFTQEEGTYLLGVFFDFESAGEGSREKSELTLVPFTTKKYAVQSAQKIEAETGIKIDYVVFYKNRAGEGKYVWVPLK